jgi:hypothetical protein
VSSDDSRERAKRFLHDYSSAEEVVQRGVPYLLTRWRRTSLAVTRGYPGDLDEYLNDMDVRQLFEDVRDCLATEGVEIPPPSGDRTVRRFLVPAIACLWGAANAAKHGWTAEKNWWYFTHPRKLLQPLRDDLERWGLLSPDQ